MSCSESIVDKYISERSKFLGELFAVLCLFLAITCILKKNNIAILHSCYSCLSILADNIVISCAYYFLAKELGKTYSNRSK